MFWRWLGCFCLFSWHWKERGYGTVLTFDRKPCRVCSVPGPAFRVLDRSLSSLVLVAADLTP